ncbi:MAG: ABC transporter ATP-binding protein [Bacteroidota bacterium]|nr:ABC transporter ATP-binding protein [Bacteroidota bacterium]
MIVLKDISKSFGNQKILNNISLKISNGDFVSVVGPSGAGKTTLINIIGTIESFDPGQNSELKLDGVEVSKLKQNEISRFRNENIGFVFQFHQLLPELNCEENILLPIRIGRKNLNDFKERLLSLSKSLNIEKILNKKPDFISGGEKQRVSFARALINNPKIILADEPTGNLDSVNSRKIIELLQKINKKYGVTVIYVTHNEQFAKTANVSYTIKDGKCIKN